MSKKKFLDLNALDVANNDDDSPNASRIADDIFGKISAADANRQRAEPTSIFEIFPDPSQPRRAIPHKVRAAIDWQGDVTRMDELFNTWIDLIDDERVKHGVLDKFDLHAHIDQRELDNKERDKSDEELESADRPDGIGALERSMLRLVALATSLYKDGLTNPITVVPMGGASFRLETGERRWLAYHLLYLLKEDDKFAKIAARRVEEFNLWRQAAENNARADLNAISKARQFAILLMDLLRRENDVQFKSFDMVEKEHNFYAQVEDGNEHRIPRGKAELLLNATGLKNKKQLREYRRLLRLPSVVWEMADDLDWTERAIRDLTERAMNEDDLIALAAQKAREEGYTVPVGTLSEKVTKTAKKPNTGKSGDVPPAPGTKAYYSYFVKTVTRAKQGKGEEREKALELIDEFRRWLDNEEQSLNG